MDEPTDAALHGGYTLTKPEGLLAH